MPIRGKYREFMENIQRESGVLYSEVRKHWGRESRGKAPPLRG